MANVNCLVGPTNFNGSERSPDTSADFRSGQSCGHHHHNQEIYNISQNCGISNVPTWWGLSGVARNCAPHKMLHYKLSLVYEEDTEAPPGAVGGSEDLYPDHHSTGSRRTSDASSDHHSFQPESHFISKNDLLTIERAQQTMSNSWLLLSQSEGNHGEQGVQQQRAWSQLPPTKQYGFRL